MLLGGRLFGAALPPVCQELRLSLLQVRGTPARANAELGINVDRDGPEPFRGRSAVSVLIEAPNVPAIIDDDVVEPILISTGQNRLWTDSVIVRWCDVEDTHHPKAAWEFAPICRRCCKQKKPRPEAGALGVMPNESVRSVRSVDRAYSFHSARQ